MIIIWRFNMAKKKNENQDICYSDLHDNTEKNKKVTAKDIEIANNTIDFIKTAEPPFFKNEGTPLMSVSLKRLADYLALNIFPSGTEIIECGRIFEQKIIAASFEEILDTWKYIRRMKKKVPCFGFSEILITTSINARQDRKEIFDKICLEPGFKRLKTQNPWGVFV